MPYEQLNKNMHNFNIPSILTNYLFKPIKIVSKCETHKCSISSLWFSIIADYCLDIMSKTLIIWLCLWTNILPKVNIRNPYSNLMIHGAQMSSIQNHVFLEHLGNIKYKDLSMSPHPSLTVAHTHRAILPTYQSDGLGKQTVSTCIGLWAAPC